MPKGKIPFFMRVESFYFDESREISRPRGILSLETA